MRNFNKNTQLEDIHIDIMLFDILNIIKYILQMYTLWRLTMTSNLIHITIQ
jgi:hypothetical protein